MVKLIIGAITGFFAGAALTKRHKIKLQKVEAGTKNSVAKKLLADARRSLVIAHTLVRMQLSRAFISTAKYVTTSASDLDSFACGLGELNRFHNEIAGVLYLAGDMHPCPSHSPMQC